MLHLKDVSANADYLPRSWAKLEIDRLMADPDPAPRSDVVGHVVELGILGQDLALHAGGGLAGEADDAVAVMVDEIVVKRNTRSGASSDFSKERPYKLFKVLNRKCGWICAFSNLSSASFSFSSVFNLTFSISLFSC